MDFSLLIKRIAKALDGQGIPYMIIGGQAVLLYSTPRLTKDIDITLGADTGYLPAVKKICGELGLKSLVAEDGDFVSKTMVFPVRDPRTDITVDFVFSFSDYERSAIKRGRRVKLGGYRVRFASPEDLIIHKMIAGRAVDIEDIRNILIKQGNKAIDISYIKKWLKKFQQAMSRNNMAGAFNKILKEAKD